MQYYGLLCDIVMIIMRYRDDYYALLCIIIMQQTALR